MRTAARRPVPGGTNPMPGGGPVRVSWLWLPLLAVFLAIPVFAHGCHGDDVDHEPAVNAHEKQE